MSIFFSGYGSRLRGLRKDRGLSLRELARCVGLSVSFICDIELDRRTPSGDTISELSRVLAVDVSPFAMIQRMVDEACKIFLAEYAAGKIEGCFNTQDFYCFDVLYCVRSDGTSFWLLDINEAVPDDPNISRRITEMMAKHGIAVEVRTSW